MVEIPSPTAAENEELLGQVMGMNPLGSQMEKGQECRAGRSFPNTGELDP